MKILFVCKHNRFRSKVAEVIFNKLNENKKIKAESAGLILDEARPFISPNVIKVLEDKGYFILQKNRISRKIDRNKIKEFDKIVIVANNIDENFFKDSFNGEIIKWDISDCSEEDINSIKKLANQLEENVIDLVKELDY